MTSQSPLASLEPRPVWELFDALRRIPRPSGDEARVVRWLEEWAAARGWSVRHDAFGNRVVSVPASPGRERAPRVVLQGHLDMVCEKNSDTTHDFSTQGIEVRVDDGWVRAEGTTLGADNGLGVALAMAAADDAETPHGPLELLMTLDEERGLRGASAFDGSLLEGRLMINLDTEEDDAVYIGCAGAGGLEAVLPLARASAAATDRSPWRLQVRGLRGGHSGMEIHDGRGNALVLAARLLVAALEQGVDFDLVAFDGGDKANAIPRECSVALRLDDAARTALEQVLEVQRPELVAQLGAADPGLELVLEPGDDERAPLTPGSRASWLRLLDAGHHGVVAMSQDIPGLVETSCNLAVARTDAAEARVLFACRSSSNPALDGLLQSLGSLARLAGAEARRHGGYPGWAPNPESPLVARTVAAYERLFGVAPAVTAIHAGLECGVLAQKVPGLDAVSIGPTIRGPHSPDEMAEIASVAKIWRWLRAVLDDLSS
ncbi:MAG: beta-Ala-His dipeptidase [Acidobacteriota bacterium]